MQSLLEAGLEKYQLDVSPERCKLLLEYITLLAKWNKAYNLTAIRDPQEMLQRHVLDSVSIHAYIQGQRCLDVGTGPGLPGLILALVQPDKNWILLDSNQKKIRFLRHVKTQLNISNIEIVQSRVESLQDQNGFSTIVCRAFSSLYDFHNSCRHLIKETGVLLAMKANVSDEELQQVTANVTKLERIDLDVIQSDTQRCLIRMTD